MIHDRAKRHPILWKLVEEIGEANGERWQNQVGDFIREVKPNVTVETGVYLGTSSDRILRALDTNNQGVLWSIDPVYQFDPAPEVHPMDIYHHRWRQFRGLSVQGMPYVYRQTGPWDVFIHDSDHSALCQTYEYTLAWELLKPGGYLLSDDLTWSEHRSWDRFLKTKNMNYKKLGHCGVVRKPMSEPAPNIGRDELDTFVIGCMTLANEAAKLAGEPERYVL